MSLKDVIQEAVVAKPTTEAVDAQAASELQSVARELDHLHTTVWRWSMKYMADKNIQEAEKHLSIAIDVLKRVK